MHISICGNNEVFCKQFFAGAIAGIVSRTVTAPLDRLKTFIQVTDTTSSAKYLYKEMMTDGGILGLWRGNLINILKNTPKSAVRFAVYEDVKRYIMMKKNTNELTLADRFYSGCIAGFASQTVVYPLEMLKLRLSLRKTGKYRSMWHAVQSIYKTEGIRSFGRGFVPSQLAALPYSGIDLAGYELMKRLRMQQMQRDLNVAEQFLFGAISCTAAQLSTYPIALICIKMQADESDVRTSKGMTQITKEIFRKEGVRGLYRGMFFNLLKFIPGMGITFVTYEQVLKLLNISMS